MHDDSGRLRFGIFMAPFHPAGENPTLLLDGDLALVEHLDRLGYDEAWIGEHHSAGSEIIASPEIFIAHAAARTRRAARTWRAAHAQRGAHTQRGAAWRRPRALGRR